MQTWIVAERNNVLRWNGGRKQTAVAKTSPSRRQLIKLKYNHVEMEKVADAKKCQESTVKKDRNSKGKCKAEDVPARGIQRW